MRKALLNKMSQHVVNVFVEGILLVESCSDQQLFFVHVFNSL